MSYYSHSPSYLPPATLPAQPPPQHYPKSYSTNNVSGIYQRSYNNRNKKYLRNPGGNSSQSCL